MHKNPKKISAKVASPFRSIFYCIVILIIFSIGIGPIIFNIFIDPYDMNKVMDLGIKKQKISERAHYPLWKMIHYPAEATDTVILGDSRARALKTKYWHELGLTGTYNFAYGGTTIYEIYDTFNFVKNNPNLKNVVLGIQLRSFDLNHKRGMNRVPEAIRLHGNPLKYYSNWFVAGVGVQLLKQKYSSELQNISSFKLSLISSAQAAEKSGGTLRGENKTPESDLTDLLLPEVCANCMLPPYSARGIHPALALKSDYYFADDLGSWRGLWSPIISDRHLEGVFAKQVKRNGKSDWNKFEFSNKFWNYISDISRWCKAHNIKLIFVIPPTVVEMQHRVVEFGFGKLNHQFRERLTAFGTVVDFDFDNSLTRDLSFFKDAYHFNSDVAKIMVGEVSQLIARDKAVITRAYKTRKNVICPISTKEIMSKMSNGIVDVLQGKSCRIWRRSDD